MAESPALYLLLAGEVRGPFTTDQLRVLAEVGTVQPEIEASALREGPWAPLRNRPDAAEIFPARREFQFKAPAYERVNHPSGPGVDHRELIAAAARGPASPPAPAAPAPNDVLELVRETSRFQAPFERPVDLTPRPNRRRFDYWLGMIVVNGALVGVIVLSRRNPATTIFAVSGMAVFSSAYTWLMYGILRRY